MTAEEIDRVKEMVLKDLPRVLEADPGFLFFIEGLINEKFPRRDELAKMLDEVRDSRKENTERFDRLDRRSDKMDARIDHLTGEVGQIRGEVGQIRGEVGQIRGEVGQIRGEVGQIRGEVRGLRHWMELNVGGFTSKAGRRLEDVVAGAFCFGLERTDIRPEHVHLRQIIQDLQGAVFHPGKKKEVDIIAFGDQIIVFEVKSGAKHDDIEDLADKTALVGLLHPGKKVEGVLVMLGAESDQRKWCAEKGLRLIP